MENLLKEPLEVVTSKLERTRIDLLKYLDKKQYRFGETREVITDTKNITIDSTHSHSMKDFDFNFGDGFQKLT